MKNLRRNDTGGRWKSRVPWNDLTVTALNTNTKCSLVKHPNYVVLKSKTENKQKKKSPESRARAECGDGIWVPFDISLIVAVRLAKKEPDYL